MTSTIILSMFLGLMVAVTLGMAEYRHQEGAKMNAMMYVVTAGIEIGMFIHWIWRG